MISVLSSGPYYTQSGTFCKNNKGKVHFAVLVNYKAVISNINITMNNQRNARLRPSRFKIEIPGDDGKRAKLLQKIQNVRQQLTTAFGRPVNNGDILNTMLYLSSGMKFPTMWYVRPAKAQTSLRIRAV